MHGNILDANSTNKLINQSVKDAVDNKLIEIGHVTKDLLEAETSARTKGDEALGAKIKAEQTRAEGKEKEISDKLAIVDGDSNTEGSFRKAIADVIAAAPEDLDTLKEIADKLAGNDDLHTALNQAITEKADASALANEVARATGAESGLQAAIATKADAAALSNYVLTTALNQQVDTLNTAISAKQDKGDYVVFSSQDEYTYNFDKTFIITDQSFVASDGEGRETTVSEYGLFINDGENQVTYTYAGIMDKSHPNCIPTTDKSFKPISDFVLKTELPTVPTKTSQLTNDSNFITANRISDIYIGLEKDLKIYSEDTGEIMTISHSDISLETDDRDFIINNNGFFVSNDDTGEDICSFSPSGIRFAGKTTKDIPTANGTFVNSDDFGSADDIYSLKVNLSRKQNKITVNEVDVTDIETADITKLRTIVINLLNALSKSNLIRQTKTLE